MKLIYVWIEKYKKLENFHLNIDSNYIIEYDEMKNEIEIQKKEKPNIFGEQISGVTGLVGKNGSGKSTTLELLSYNNNIIRDEYDDEKFCKYMYIYSTSKDEEYIIETNFFNLDSISDAYQTINNSKRIIYKYYPKAQNKFEKLDSLSDTVKIIRYKLDLMLGEQNKGSILSIPRYNLGAKINFQDLFNLFYQKNKWFEAYKDSKFSIYLKGNVNKYNENFDIQLEKLVSTTKERIENEEMNMGVIRNNKLINRLKNELEKMSAKDRFLEKYLINNININFREILNEILIDKDLFKEKIFFEGNKIAKKSLEEIKNDLAKKIYDYENEENRCCDSLEKIKIYMEVLNETWNLVKKIKQLKGEINPEYYEEVIGEQHKLLHDFFYLLNELSEEYFLEDKVIINLKEEFTAKEKEVIDKLLKKYDELPDYLDEKYEIVERVRNFINIFLEGTSDGEKILLNILSFIENLVQDIINVEENIKEVNNFIILFDEIELYLHPEWSRKIFNEIIENLNRVKKCRFQLIFATHTPFIISNMPKENVIILESENGVIKSKECEIETFGANIFDLYKNTFFIESSFGEFARKNIKKLVNATELDDAEIESAEYLISSIGEKLIRTQLEKRLKKIKSQKK